MGFAAVFYQGQVADRVKESVIRIEQTQGHLLTRRPFQVTWFSSQVAICLGLWEYNRELLNALDLAKTFLIPLDALNALWPCPGTPRDSLGPVLATPASTHSAASAEQRVRRDELRSRLVEACLSAGMHPPLPEEVTLPPRLRRNPHSAI